MNPWDHRNSCALVRCAANPVHRGSSAAALNEIAPLDAIVDLLTPSILPFMIIYTFRPSNFEIVDQRVDGAWTSVWYANMLPMYVQRNVRAH